MSLNRITCPQCKNEFEPGDAVREQLRRDMQEWKQKQQKDFEQREQEWQKQQLLREAEIKKAFERERELMEVQAAKEQEEKFARRYETEIKHLHESNFRNEELLKAAREKEMDFLKKMTELQAKEQEMSIKMQQQLLEERQALSVRVRQEEEERGRLKEQEMQFRMKELEQQLEQQRKLAEEMKRKADQGSMQLQGEVQELLLEELLRRRFPFDTIEEVGKGVRGGDCVQIVCNKFGEQCGKIVYESKRTANFGADWIEKVKADMRAKSADLAVIVTQVMPKDMDTFGMKDGVWICSFREAGALALMLREQILRVHHVTRSSEQKSDKMTLLYEYLTGNEFSEQWNAVREGFQSMKISIQKERDAMERLWKAREKQLEKILLNAAHIKGSVDGISGSTHIDFGLNEADDILLLPE